VLGGQDQVQLKDALAGCDRASLEMHLEAEIEYLRDALGGLDETELRDANAGHDRVSLEMHLEAMIDRDWSGTWMWSIWRWQIMREVRRQLRLYVFVYS
jgi:hypothetical protein